MIIESDSSTRKIMPNEAIARNLTYSAPMYLTYVPVVSGIEKGDAAGEAFVGEMPVMVKSDLCYTHNMTAEQLVSEGEDPDDPGGYFIIKGTERVLVGIRGPRAQQDNNARRRAAARWSARYSRLR